MSPNICIWYSLLSAGPQGNHGEDCKENYYYLDSSPTHSYMKGLYKYPQDAYPYERLEQEARERSVLDREFELEDAGNDFEMKKKKKPVFLNRLKKNYVNVSHIQYSLVSSWFTYLGYLCREIIIYM